MNFDSFDNVKRNNETEKTIIKQSPREKFILAGLSFGQKSAEIFSHMSDQAKTIAGKAYEMILKTPGINRLAAKLEISVDQFFVDLHQLKEDQRVNNLTEVERKINTLEKSKEAFKKHILAMEKLNYQKVAKTLVVQLQKMEQQIEHLSTKKMDLEQAAPKTDRVNHYLQKRNAIADRLINYYQEKSAPFEKTLASLEKQKNTIQLQFSVAENVLKQNTEKLEKIKETLIQSYSALEMTKKAVDKTPAFRVIKNRIELEQKKIDKLRNKFSQQKAVLDEKINYQKEAIESIRDRQKIFVQAKQRPSARLNAKPEEPLEEFPKTTPETEKNKASSVENPSFELNNFIEQWNQYLKEQFDESPYILDKENFLTKTLLNGKNKVEIATFKKILSSYFKFKRINTDNLLSVFNQFFGVN